MNGFPLFGPLHLGILASIPLTALLLARLVRRGGMAASTVRYGLGLATAVNEIVWYIYRYSSEGLRFPEGLPLQLCDLTLWLAVVTVLTLNQWAFEVVFFAGLAGAGMALITPDLWSPWPSYPAIYYFLAHALIILCPVVLLLGGLLRLRSGCLKHVFIVLNGYAVAIGLFNWIFGSNYMYLCRKPANPSLLDFLGLWPLYILSAELVGFVLFWLLWLPFRPSASLVKAIETRGEMTHS